MSEKKRFIKLTSPAGVAVYPYVNKGAPAQKYKKPNEFEYKIDLALDPQVEECKKFIAKLEEVAQSAFENAQKKLQKAVDEAKTDKDREKAESSLNRLQKSDVYKEELDSDKEPTGRILVGFKMNDHYIIKKGQRAGERVDTFPTLFDSQGQPLPVGKAPAVWAGSKVKVGFDAGEFHMGSPNDIAGVSKRLAAVQIIELVTKGQVSAQEYGFEDTGGSFSAASISDDEGESKRNADSHGDEDYVAEGTDGTEAGYESGDFQ